ncbi:GIY-YIG nuclease family protein [Nodosilinea sp. LEGE 07298]|uniref:GIY-YIG nuclease family protein n=1 Tax=Nodosilinea sp. LEGE 07298 TaxID=2777970 RepID=UPI00187F4073|nr:GIY-YIG nuclease family protein [Nodosilinea sp. LEGE 07298]MBE9113409.1 GIY-YIG nuclease family protein [Nodosilinea sp. LEGE 07298]
MPGIYEIKNTVNGHSYIGLTSRNVSVRHPEHWCNLRGNRHANPYLQAAWNLHGESAFQFTVLEECRDDGELLGAIEIGYIAFLKATGQGAEYSLLLGGQHGKHSEETKEKLRRINKGKKQSAELVEKRISKIRGVKRSPQTAEHRENLRIAKSTKVWVFYDPDNNLIEFKGLNKFCDDNSLDSRCMHRVYHSQKDSNGRAYIQHKGYSIKPKPVLVSPDGQEHIITNNLAALARLYKLDNSCLAKVVRGKLKHHKQWKLKENKS